MDRKKALKSGIIAITLLVVAISIVATTTTATNVRAVVEDEGEFVPNKPLPYCDKVSDDYTGGCHDRFDYEDGDFASCNDGSQREDPEDCPDATESESNDEDSNSNERDPYETKNDNDIPGCQNGVIQKCVIKEIGLICNLEDRYAPINPSVVGGGHACQDIYAGIYKSQSEAEPESELKDCGDGIVAVSCGVGRYWCSGGSGNSFHTNDWRDCKDASSSGKNTESESKPELYTCNDGTKKADWRDCDYRADGSYPCSDGTYEVDLKACNIAARLKNNG